MRFAIKASSRRAGAEAERVVGIDAQLWAQVDQAVEQALEDGVTPRPQLHVVPSV